VRPLPVSYRISPLRLYGLDGFRLCAWPRFPGAIDVCLDSDRAPVRFLAGVVTSHPLFRNRLRDFPPSGHGSR